MHPRWARVAGGMWLVAGVALLASGVVVVIDQHAAMRWEFPAAALALAAGARLWGRRVIVDAHGFEQRVGWRRTRVWWNAVERVAVGDGGRPVQVWRTGRSAPLVPPALSGASRRQRAHLAEAIEEAVAPFGIEVLTAPAPPRKERSTT